MGDLAGEIRVGGGGEAGTTEVEVRFRTAFRGQRIMVPKVLHRDGKDGYRELDYEADVLGSLDYEAMSYRRADAFNLAATM